MRKDAQRWAKQILIAKLSRVFDVRVLLFNVIDVAVDRVCMPPPQRTRKKSEKE